MIDTVERSRLRIVVTGVVQGVGFRPFVHRLAGDLGLAGFVGNDSSCVFIEVEGEQHAVHRFAERMRPESPPLARIDTITAVPQPPTFEAGFRIVESAVVGGARTFVPPDVAMCDECLGEVLDPADRRYRYPFANCTNCGPRFTIIRDLPYDRPATTMSMFTMCPDCRREYDDPDDRRYHAQPIACPTCGPHIMFRDHDAETAGTDAAIAAVHRALAAGRTVAIKGIGGYHLACDATSDAAVELLRHRKARGDKPFAVMVGDLDHARELAEIGAVEEVALTSPARPIVLLGRRDGAGLSAAVAPGNPLVGVVLPYTPLHHLLFLPVPGASTEPPAALVLTSGNVADEPICIDDDEAMHRLGALADAYLVHDRPIHVACDDSVVRVIDGRLVPIRRSRGYAPLPVTLPVPVVPTLAMGGELKNTFCIASGRHAWVSQHIGDMENLQTLNAFERSVGGYQGMYDLQPRRLAADLHPGYLTRRWAFDHAGDREVVGVQHHHAHVAAVMAEHGLDGSFPVLGFAFDGTGYGTGDDGRPEIWGGEVLIADYAGFERAGHLRPLPLPGGDASVENPCRIAVAYLAALGLAVDPSLPAVAACTAIELGLVLRQVERNVGCVPTTSMGRLFDAVSSLLGVRHRVAYEAEAAIELEVLAGAAADDGPELTLQFGLDDGIIDPAPVLSGLIGAHLAGAPAATAARAFHRAVADVVVRSAVSNRQRCGSLPVALSGGVFQNALLTRLCRDGLEAEGFGVLTHQLVPPNDGGLSLGQAVIAGYGRE